MMLEICPNLKNKQVAKEFGELKDLFEEEVAHLLWSRNNGYSIDKAPNGADSILFGELLQVANGDRIQALILKAKTYSNEFFDWFGDWTSDDKTNVSKVVDKNGEPHVTYHTVSDRYDPSFKKFDTTIEGAQVAIYHTDSYTMSASYNRAAQEVEKGNRYGYYYQDDHYKWTKVDYLNIRNPKIIDAEGRDWEHVERTGSDLYPFLSTRDIEEKYLLRGDDRTERDLKRISRLQNLIETNQINYNKINTELNGFKTVLGLNFWRNNNGHIFFSFGENGGKTAQFDPKYYTSNSERNEAFKHSVSTLLNDVVGLYNRYKGNGTYDGVIINNVRDYGNGEYGNPHTVYECIGNFR